MSSTPCNIFVCTFLFFNSYVWFFTFATYNFLPNARVFLFGWGGIRKSDLGKERNGKERVFGCSPLPRTKEEEEEEGKTEKATNGC